MGFFTEVGREFKRKSKKVVTVTPHERKGAKGFGRKTRQNLSKAGRQVDFSNLVHGARKKKDISKIKVKGIRGKFKKGKKKFLIVEI